MKYSKSKRTITSSKIIQSNCIENIVHKYTEEEDLNEENGLRGDSMVIKDLCM
jgi:hypothetical protein